MINPNTGQPLEAPAVVAVNKWDNHAVHIQEHDNFRKSPAYDMLTPTQKAEFNKHINIHEMALANLQAQQMLVEQQSGQPAVPQQEQPTQ
jgi:hypothetical protein